VFFLKYSSSFLKSIRQPSVFSEKYMLEESIKIADQLLVLEIVAR